MLTGLDRLPHLESLVRELSSRRIGLLAHPASVDRKLRHTSSRLRSLGISPSIYFGPEHGFGGEAQDMIGVSDAQSRDGCPIRSLYGDAFDDLSPKAADLSGLDVLIVDLQDIGSRYYTFVWTAVLALRACSAKGVSVLVLDRPNPLGGQSETLEGTPQREDYRSFVGLEPISVRHSLTLGEIVAHRAELEGLPGDALRVVTTEGLARELHATAWDRPFVMPSPNMPSYETALVYPGGCLLEGTNLSEGRGTTRPFEIFGAPWVDGERLAERASHGGIQGAFVRPLTFRPTFHKYQGQICGGVQVHVIDPAKFRPYRTYLQLIAHCHREWPKDFCFRTERYEFVDHIPAFDLLTGSPVAREAILAGEDFANWGDGLCAAQTDLWKDARHALQVRAYDGS